MNSPNLLGGAPCAVLSVGAARHADADFRMKVVRGRIARRSVKSQERASRWLLEGDYSQGLLRNPGVSEPEPRTQGRQGEAQGLPRPAIRDHRDTVFSPARILTCLIRAAVRN